MNLKPIALTAVGIVLAVAQYVAAAPGGAQTPFIQTPVSVPEPLTGVLLGVGLLSIWLVRRR
jgi:hypothetical protein